MCNIGNYAVQRKTTGTLRPCNQGEIITRQLHIARIELWLQRSTVHPYIAAGACTNGQEGNGGWKNGEGGGELGRGGGQNGVPSTFL